jgi:hypothetical protein
MTDVVAPRLSLFGSRTHERKRPRRGQSGMPSSSQRRNGIRFSGDSARQRALQ